MQPVRLGNSTLCSHLIQAVDSRKISLTPIRPERGYNLYTCGENIDGLFLIEYRLAAILLHLSERFAGQKSQWHIDARITHDELAAMVARPAPASASSSRTSTCAGS